MTTKFTREQRKCKQSTKAFSKDTKSISFCASGNVLSKSLQKSFLKAVADMNIVFGTWRKFPAFQLKAEMGSMWLKKGFSCSDRARDKVTRE